MLTGRSRQEVARRHDRPEELIVKLRELDALFRRGKKLAEIVKQLGIHEETYYRWRNEYGGVRVDQMKRLKDLEQDNARP